VDGHVNFNARLDVDVDDLLEHLGRRVKVDETLVDSHLVEVPGLGTFTVWGLTGVDSKSLGWHTDRALDSELLLLGSLDELLADLLNVRGVGRGKRDSDTVILGVASRHFSFFHGHDGISLPCTCT